MYLYGASGHGKVIKDILEAQGIKVDGFIDDNPSINDLAGLPVLHSTEKADEVIVSIGDNRARKKVVEKLNCEIADSAVHSAAVVADTVYIDKGTVLMAGTVVNADAKIGKHCIVNTGATVDHECMIEDYVHIAPGVNLCGQVHVGEGTLVGVACSVIPCIHIGKWCVIGAGSVVVNDIPDGCLAYGNPCRIVKIMNQDMIKIVEPNCLGGQI